MACLLIFICSPAILVDGKITPVSTHLICFFFIFLFAPHTMFLFLQLLYYKQQKLFVALQKIFSKTY
nr:MAG TPA: hypothetical protein [Caudoviricetes sp.]